MLQAALGKQVDEPIPSLPIMLQLRKTGNDIINDGYLFFCQKFVKCVVGLQAYNRGVKDGLTFSEIASPSDEGLALILLENSCKRWVAEYDEKAKTTGNSNNQQLQIDQGTEYTTAGKNKAKKGFTKKYCGWSRAGIEKFNQLVCRIRADRAKNGVEFDQVFARTRPHKDSEGNKENDEVIMERIVRAENDLVFEDSDSEDESDGDNDDSEDDSHGVVGV